MSKSSKSTKSRQQANATRKKGWQQAAKGWKDQTKALMQQGKDIASGALSGAAEGGARAALEGKGYAAAISKGLAGAGAGAAKAAGKTTIDTLSKMGKGAWNVVKGVAKGIFNHPSWYEYRGALSIPAANAKRPFDPKSVTPIMGSNKVSPGVGTTHVVQQNVVFTRPSQCEGFDLAAIEAFKAIRRQLKSNLPYTQQEFNNYIDWAVSILARGKQIERTMGWYNVTRGDIPELQDAISTVAANKDEVGKVSSLSIDMISGSNYASSLASYTKLQAVLRNIPVPVKIAEFVSWWLGGSFIDQSAMNPQIYLNFLRSCPSFDATAMNNITEVSLDDIANMSVQNLVAEATKLLNVFGVIIADIEKLGSYGYIQISDVTAGAYNPVYLDDPEFFSILVNCYTLDRSHGVFTSFFNSEYVRVDVKEELNESNTVGVCNALAKWSGKKVPFMIVSQNAYFTIPDSGYTPRNVTTTVTVSGTVQVPLRVQGGSAFRYQFTSNGVVSNSVVYDATSTSYTVAPTMTNKIAADNTATATSVSFRFENDGVLAAIACSKQANGHYKSKQPLFTTPGGVSYYLDVTPGVGTITAAVIDTINVNVLPALQAYYGQDDNMIFGFDNTVITTTNATACAALKGWFQVGSTSYLGTPVASISLSVTAGSAAVTQFNETALDSMVEQVDYHLPVFRWSENSITIGASKIRVTTAETLMKECYVPLIFNYADIDAVLYWMHLGLFSALEMN